MSNDFFESFDKFKAALGSYKVVRKFEEKLLLGYLRLDDSGQLDFKRYDTMGAYPDELWRISDFRCVVVFPKTGFPPIKCGFYRLLECLITALAVSPYMWVIGTNGSRVIEFYQGMITICGT